jgi:hypothetical protein
MHGLAISPPRFSKYCETAIPPEFSEKNRIGGKSWSEAPVIEMTFYTDPVFNVELFFCEATIILGT